MSRSSKHPVWRNSNGKIECFGDSCAQERCDETCPVYLNTQGGTLANTGDLEGAILLFKKAMKLAPDFDDLWSNLGACYGQKREYNRALEAYRHAWAISHKQGAAFGMASALRDLGKYDEAIAICDEYEKKAHDGGLMGLREQIERCKSGKTQAENRPDAHALLIGAAKEKGFLTQDSDASSLPSQLTDDCDALCERIRKALFAEDDNATASQNRLACFAWCTYAGLGCTYMFRSDKATFVESETFDTLTSTRGLDEMDEYVTELFGISYDSDEGRCIAIELRRLSQIADQLCAFMRADETAAMRAMYIIGVLKGMMLNPKSRSELFED